MYSNVKSLCSTPETNIILYVNDIAIKKKPQHESFSRRIYQFSPNHLTFWWLYSYGPWRAFPSCVSLPCPLPHKASSEFIPQEFYRLRSVQITMRIAPCSLLFQKIEWMLEIYVLASYVLCPHHYHKYLII